MVPYINTNIVYSDQPKINCRNKPKIPCRYVMVKWHILFNEETKKLVCRVRYTFRDLLVCFLYFYKKIKAMKNSRKEESRQSKQGHVNTPRPDIRDEMDSRKEKEPGFRENDNRPDKKKSKKDVI